MIILLLAIVPAQGGWAKEAEPLAEDPAIEARLMTLAENLRCLVCQNQTLAMSESDFANDLRREMRDMMKRGMTDKQIVDFLVQRFGDFILFKPPVKETTVPLWFGPLLLVIVGVTVLVLVLRRRNREETVISADEHQRAEALLHNNTEEGEGRA